MLSLTKLSLLLIPVCLWSQSCAAMFTGTKSTVLVDSEPRGIPFVAGTVEGVTPQTVKISKKTKEITFTPEGTAPVTQKLERHFQGGMLLMDILFTPGYGLVGIVVDGSTSAWFKHDPSVFFELNEATVVEAPAALADEQVGVSP